MTTINKSALVRYTPQQMFQLVDDINRYAEFLPWCGQSQETTRTTDQVEASLTISYSGLNKAFTTRNKLMPHQQIEMQLVEGPFKFLHGLWQFEALGDDGCKVSLNLEFEFSSKLVGMTVGPVFNKIANTLVDAFIQRADAVYDAN